jgi:hypothetical protein
VGERQAKQLLALLGSSSDYPYLLGATSSTVTNLDDNEEEMRFLQEQRELQECTVNTNSARAEAMYLLKQRQQGIRELSSVDLQLAIVPIGIGSLAVIFISAFTYLSAEYLLRKEAAAINSATTAENSMFSSTASGPVTSELKFCPISTGDIRPRTFHSAPSDLERYENPLFTFLLRNRVLFFPSVV